MPSDGPHSLEFRCRMGEWVELGDETGWVAYRDVESRYIGHEGLGGASYANDVPPEGATSVVIEDQEGEHVPPVENGEVVLCGLGRG